MLHIPGDVRDAIAFYERAFGATMGWSTPPAEDMVAQLLVRGAEFWVHPASEAIGNPSPQPSGTAVRLMLIVDDPDAVFDQSVAAGAVVRSPMQNRETNRETKARGLIRLTIHEYPEAQRRRTRLDVTVGDGLTTASDRNRGR